MSILNLIILICLICVAYKWHRSHKITRRLEEEKRARLNYIDASIREALCEINVAFQCKMIPLEDKLALGEKVRSKFLTLMDDAYVDAKIKELLLIEAKERELHLRGAHLHIEEISSPQFDESVFDDEETIAERDNIDRAFGGTRKPISKILDEIYK